MSQDTPQPERTRVEFSPASIRRRLFISRLFRGFALCATFFGLAMLLIFLGRLTWDVSLWFQQTPVLIQARNERESRRVAEFTDRLAKIDAEEARKLKNEPDPKEREAIQDESEIERENTRISLKEVQREVDANLRPDTSSGAIFWHFLTHGPSEEANPQDAGILYGLLGTVALVFITLLIALPIGVGAAIYLEEYRSTHWLARVIQININNLAGVPSVMFGILGAFLFVECVFRPIEIEMERPARVQEYVKRYQQLRNEGTITQELSSDSSRLVSLVVDPSGQLEKIRESYQRLVEQGKAPANPRDEKTRIRAVLDPENKLADFLARYDRLRKEKKITELAKSDHDVPALVLAAEGKAPAEIAREKAFVEPMRQAEQKASRIAIDQQLLSPPNYLLQWVAGTFRVLGVSMASRNVLGGGMTLALLILPILIVASQEAIRAVPQSLRHGSLALGATQWQTIRKIVLPSAAPGILTGTILAMCRAMGEAAPLVLFGATLYIDQLPTLFSRFTVMPMQIFVWSDRVSEAWRHNAALASFVLLLVLLVLNGVAIYLRQRSQSQTRY